MPSQIREVLIFMSEDKVKKLKEKREYWRTRVFWLLLEIALIFGVPAAIGVLIGRWVEVRYGFGDKFTIGILFLTFIFSWFLVFIRYKQVKGKLDEIDKEIEREQRDGGK